MIETALEGGAMITARYAYDYGRPIFAVPGGATDESFSGCLKLMPEHGALLVRDASDILKAPARKEEKREKERAKPPIPLDLTTEEKAIYDFIRQKGEAHFDSILLSVQLPAPVSLLLSSPSSSRDLWKSCPAKDMCLQCDC